MITIQVMNAERLVEKQLGRFAAAFGTIFLDLHIKVEEAVMEEVIAVLAEHGVEAVVERRT